MMLILVNGLMLTLVNGLMLILVMGLIQHRVSVMVQYHRWRYTETRAHVRFGLMRLLIV